MPPAVCLRGREWRIGGQAEIGRLRTLATSAVAMFLIRILSIWKWLQHSSYILFNIYSVIFFKLLL